MRRPNWIFGALVGCLMGGTAFAAISAEDVTERLNWTEDGNVPPVSVQLQAGVMDYQGGLGDHTDAGPLLGVTVDARRQQYIGAELGYEGTRNEVSENFVAGDDGAIWKHTGTALIKGGPVIRNFMPFVGTGVGLSYVNVNDAAEDANFDNDFIVDLPLAAGVDYRVGNIAAGIRGTYRVQFDEDFAEGTGGDTGGNALQGSLTLGGRF